MKSKTQGRKLSANCKFTPEIAKAIVNDISNRIPYALAAEANGICEDTLYEWINRGKRDKKEGIESGFATFSESIKKTELKKIREHMEVIAEREKNWQAHAWILERRWYKYFSPNAPILEFERRLKQLEEGDLDEQAQSKST